MLILSSSFFPCLWQLVPQYREKAKKLEEQVQTFDKLKDMEKKVDELEQELHWAMVYEIESVCNLPIWRCSPQHA